MCVLEQVSFDYHPGDLIDRKLVCERADCGCEEVSLDRPSFFQIYRMLASQDVGLRA